MNVKRKGNAGEREFLSLLSGYGIQASRNDQRYVGGQDNPDISAVIGGTAFHVEVKRTERFRLYDALEQAQRDANGHRIPLVAHRQNHRPWVVVLDASDFIRLLEGGYDVQGIPEPPELCLQANGSERKRTLLHRIAGACFDKESTCR